MNLKQVSCFLVLYALSSYGNLLIAQSKSTGSVSGKLIDSVSQETLKDATVSVLHSRDSSVLSFGLSKADGSFLIGNIPYGSYVLVVTFLGYESAGKPFTLSGAKDTYDAATIYLKRYANVLEEVFVQASPIVIKGDTTEFNASYFKTIPNATAEDLFRKLPGIEVERDGSVKSNGEVVTRIFVDGKRFFGNDPKMATRNLPTDIIDKIQVIDALSDQSQFSGFDDGERIKTINIITKKDRRKGVFGKASFAAGDIGRHANAISANMFNGDQKISFIGQNNNINNQNFSIQDFLGTMNSGGGNARSGGGRNVFAGNQSGISATVAGGLNYDDVWGKNTDANGSYFYNKVNTTNNRNRFRETFIVNDSSLFNTNQFLSGTNNLNHRFNFDIEHRFDSSNSVVLRPNFSSQQTNSYSETNSFTTKGRVTNLNEVKSILSSRNEGYNFNNSLLFRHRFKRRGRTFSVNLTQNLNTNERYGTNLSYNNKYSRGVDTISQVSSTIRDGRSYGASLSYTEPLSLKSQVELTYRYNYSQNNSDQQTYKLDKSTGEHIVSVPNLTNKFENSNRSQTGGVNYRMEISKQWNYSVGIAVQQAELISNNLSKHTILNQSFNNFFPNLNIQFRKGRSANFRFNYRGSTQQPNISQLQDVIDNTNILNVRTGNPALKQEFSNNFALSYTSFNRVKFTNLAINLNAGAVSNKIANTITLNTGNDSIVIDGFTVIPGAQFSKPQNLDGAFNINANANYSFPVIKQRSSLHLGGRVNYNRDVNLYNNVLSYTRNYGFTGTVRLTMNLKERFDMNFASSSNYNISRYSSGNRQNGDFFTQRFSVEPTYTTRQNWILFNDFDYFMNSGQSSGFNQSVPLWNAGLAKLFLKRKQGELRITVFDILNTNKSITRNIEQNYVEDVQTQVLKRYFLISFTYHLRKFKGMSKPQKSPDVKQPAVKERTNQKARREMKSIQRRND